MQKLLLILRLSFLLTISPASAIHISDLNLDSLWSIWHDKTQADTNRLNAIQELVDIMQHSDPDSVLSLGQLLYDLAEEKDLAKYMANGLNTQAIYFVLKHDLPKAIKLATKSLQISEELGYKQGMAQSNNILGLAYVFQGEFDKADDYCSRSLKIAEELGHKLAIAMAINSKGQISLQQGDLSGAMDNFSRLLQISEDLMNSEKNMIRKFAYENVNAKGILNIGTISMYQGDYLNSLDHFLRSLKIFEAAGNKPTAALARQNIGAIYMLQGNYPQAIVYLIPSLEFFQENDDKHKALHVLINLGVMKTEQGDYSRAMDYYDRGLKLAEEINDIQNTAYVLGSMGILYQLMGNYSQGHTYIARGLTILEAIGDKLGLSNSLIAKAQVYQKQGKYSLAITNASKGLQLAQEAGAALESRDAAKALYDAHKAMGHHQQTLESYELYIKMRDSLTNTETTRKLAEQEYKYEYEIKAAADSINNAEASKLTRAQLATQRAENARQQQQAYFLYAGLALTLLFGGFIFNRLRVTRRQKKMIEEQKELVEEQKKDITDSINYAENIQQALLPTIENLKDVLPDGFVLFQPKDIVSGDFYWLQHHKDKVYFAVCDCTGHGVPGAFMSMIGSSLLDEAVVEKGITKPNEIFFEVRKGIINILKQTEEDGSQKDGMDAVLCSWNQNGNLEYALAYNPLLLIRNGAILETKADKQPVGFQTEQQNAFTHHELQLEKGDTVYLFSDGYSDQFGGPKDKKFMMRNFKKLLLSIQDKTMNEQKTILEDTMKEWKGNTEQIDDILVMGVRF